MIFYVYKNDNEYFKKNKCFEFMFSLITDEIEIKQNTIIVQKKTIYRNVLLSRSSELFETWESTKQKDDFIYYHGASFPSCTKHFCGNFYVKIKD